MRRTFKDCLYKEMLKNDKIIVLTGDLGYGMFDDIKNMFPERFYNVGASEQAMVGIAVGLALEGYIPVCYSITPFLLYRPFEFIRNYLHNEYIPVKLIGGGRDKDYLADGFTHWAKEAKEVLKVFKNIKSYFPEKKEEVPDLVKLMIANDRPTFISLKR